jgi:hypothetical protein
MCAALQDAAEWEFDDPAAPETVASLVALWAAMRPFAGAERARDLDTLTGHAQTAGTVATDRLTPDAAAAGARIDEWVVSACPPAGLASPRPSVAPPELGPAPKWGQPLPDVSAWRAVGRLDAGGLRITVWDAGESVSPRDSEWIDPDTRRPLVQAGDTLNWWVWTATNVSGQPLNLTSQLARVQARWSNTGPGRAHQTDDRAGLERLGARFDQWLNPNKGPYTLAPGETICGGGNMRSWLPTDSIDSPMMRVQATVIPAGSDGQPDLARKVERATRMNW